MVGQGMSLAGHGVINRTGGKRMGKARSEERSVFLSDVRTTAIEHAGYGFPEEVRVTASGDPVIVNRHETDGDLAGEWTVTLDVIAHGIGLIQGFAVGTLNGDGPFCITEDGQRAFLSPAQRKVILAASRENDAGDLDVIDALAILEVALFGAVVYG